MNPTGTTEARTLRLFLTRGVIAIAWAAVFATVADSLTLGAGILVVAYPLIDVVASLVDARTQHGSARQILLGGAAVSGVAAVALGVAATGSIADVLAVFGVWAALSGAAQLVVALRRRTQLGKQVPMLLAGGVSVIAGVAYLVASAGTDPRLNMLAIYAAAGGIDFVIEAWLLARRRRHLAGAGATMHTYHLTETTTATPTEVLAAITDFGPGRQDIFGNSADEFLEVHELGADSADVTEGTGKNGHAVSWERLRYDWSDASRVTMQVLASNVWSSASRHTYAITPQADGTTRVDVDVVREGKNLKGRVLAVVVSTIGTGSLAKALHNTIKAIERREARSRVAA